MKEMKKNVFNQMIVNDCLIEEVYNKVALIDDSINKEFLVNNLLKELKNHQVITDENLLDIIIKIFSCNINESNLNYDKIAARLLLYKINKAVNDKDKGLSLFERIKKRIKNKLYDDVLIICYTQNEINYVENEIMKKERDELLSYAGVRQFYDKYLIKNKLTGENYETIQECNILICLVIFAKVDKSERLALVAKMYNLLSSLIISLPTPIYSGVRTLLKNYSSCCIIDCDDSVDSILNCNYILAKAITERYGIGLNINRIRGLGSSVANGSIIHSGILPILKMIESSTKAFMQNSIRNGSCTVSFTFWNWELLTILNLKNNKGVQENRVRNLDYSIGINRFFLERVLANDDITLFSANDVPLLNNNYKLQYEEFKQIYLNYENDEKITRKKKVNSLFILKKVIKERFETGRIFIYFIDNINSYSCFKESIFASNLCQEITLPTRPITNCCINTMMKNDCNNDDCKKNCNNEGLIGVCILSCINVGRLLDIDNFSDLEEVCFIVVYFLNCLIDYQQYTFQPCAECALKYRPLGIGISDLFHLLAKKKLKYNTKECFNYIHKLGEKFQYSLIKASCKLSKKYGKCEYYSRSCYSDHSYLPITCYKQTIDSFYDEPLRCDWFKLRKKVDKYGLRNCCLSAIPPTATSCSISNSTPGIDPPKSLITTKVSKTGTFLQCVPELSTLREYYTLQSDIITKDYFKLIGILQKFIDQSISTNSYYLNENYKLLSYGDIINEIYTAYNYGLKTLYYLNSDKGVDTDIKSLSLYSNFSSHETLGTVNDEDNNNCIGGACSI